MKLLSKGGLFQNQTAENCRLGCHYQIKDQHIKADSRRDLGHLGVLANTKGDSEENIKELFTSAE